MARKTFISYKYSEAQDLRNRILCALGDDAVYYQGETSDSPDLTDRSTEAIKRSIRDMMYDTSVTIVIVSPNFAQSKWIDWEIQYCLSEFARRGRTSQTNGVVGVIQNHSGDCRWLVSYETRPDGCQARSIDPSRLYPIINNNRFNARHPVYVCGNCKTFDLLSGSYISLVEEGDFLHNPKRYIENAYGKSEGNSFVLSKQRQFETKKIGSVFKNQGLTSRKI